MLLRKLLPDLRATEHTGDLQPAFTSIVRTIVDPRSEATKAQVVNGAGDGAGRITQESESGDVHGHLREGG